MSSTNLVHYVVNPFKQDAYFNFTQYKKDVAILNRMLDNVIDIANLPLERQRLELIRKRRHGIGFLGLGSTFALLNMRYGNNKSIELTKQISSDLAITSIRAGVELAQEKGPAPIMEELFTIDEHLLCKNYRLRKDFKVGDIVPGKVLLTYSGYMSRVDPFVKNGIKIYGMRYSHATSLAPTGTLAFGIGNNVSGGIEPSFEHEATRNVIKIGKKTKEAVKVYSYEGLLYKKLHGEDAQFPKTFVTANELTPMEHINIQAAAQPFIDSAISKCIAVGTRVVTNKGMIRIESFTNNRTIDTSERLLDKYEVLCSDGIYKPVLSHYYNGIGPTKIISFDNGIEKEVSLNHKLFNIDNNWVKAEDLKIGDKILYKPAEIINDCDGNNKIFYSVVGVLLNNNTILNKNDLKIVSNTIINLKKFVEDIKNLNNKTNIECNNGLVTFDDYTYQYFNELKEEFDINRLFNSSVIERKEFINSLRTINLKNYKLIIIDHADQYFAKDINELLYSIGIDSGIIKTDVTYRVMQINENMINELKKENHLIPLSITNIKDSTSELFDITVQDTHEYLINGIVSHNTINCDTNIPFDDFKNIYMDAYDKNLKGVTCFRFNPENFQGVIVKDENLKNTKYKITLEDNTTLELSGEKLVNYDDNETTVANLYDALKEGYYNKF